MHIITEIITKIRQKYIITPEILIKLRSGDDYFPPIFEKRELLKIDIHEPSAAPPRIIAFGDIHGDLQALVGILYAAELINADGDWIEAQSTYLVQTGDLFDNYRPDVKNSCLKDTENLFDEFIILNYLTHLHIQAQRLNAQNRIVLCIGNHEFINITGDKKRMTEYVIEIKKSTLTIDERIELFKPGGVFATKLSSIFRVIAKIGNHLFMHGGIHEGNITSLNDIVIYNNNLNEWLMTPKDDGARRIELSPKIYSGDTLYLSIAWYRKMIDSNEDIYIRFLNSLDAKHELKVIVGHTITNKGNGIPLITKRARNRIILLDTAMSRCWNNKGKKPCDLSNNLYNISFIVIEEDSIISKNKQTLIDKVSTPPPSTTRKTSSSSRSADKTPPDLVSKSPSPTRKTSSSPRGAALEPSKKVSSSSPRHLRSKSITDGGRIFSINNRKTKCKRNRRVYNK
jgi:hypothetical protein